MDSTTLFKANVYLTILFMSLDKTDEKDAFYIKCLLALGSVVGTFGFLFQPPTVPTVPTVPPTVPTVPPKVPPKVTTWKPNTVYTINDRVTVNGTEWKCITNHKSSTEFIFDTIYWRHPSFEIPVTVPVETDFTVSLIDPQPYHSGSVLFKRLYKNVLSSLNQNMIKKCIKDVPKDLFVTPTRQLKITLGLYSVDCFVNTNGIYFNLNYLENLYTKHSNDNNVDQIRQNFLNELLDAYTQFVKLKSGVLHVRVRTTLIENKSGIKIVGRIRELVDNRDIHGFAAKTLPFKFEHLGLNDPNYTNSGPYKKYKELLSPLGVSESEYYLMVAREVTNLMNPGELKTALHDSIRRITIKLNTMSPGVIAFVRSYSAGDKKEMEWNRDIIMSNRIDNSGRQRFIDTLFHETAHCIDHVFSKNKVATPGYVAEGFANWCENKIKGVSWLKWSKPRPNDWRGAYDIFSVFLEYVERNSPNFVVKFHHIKVNNGYSEQIIKETTGKTGDDWWNLYLSNPNRTI